MAIENSELAKYIASKGWVYRQGSQDNIAVRDCPFCSSHKHKFWIHTKTALYRCWVCRAKGNLRKLKRELGDTQSDTVDRPRVTSAAKVGGKERERSAPIPMKAIDRWHAKLLQDQRAMRYLAKRGLGIEAAQQFKLGLRVKGGKRWLAIPHIVDGVCENAKFRSLPPQAKAFRRKPGAASVLFNADVIDEYDELVLCEAELDAISFWQAGVQNVIALTCGADTFKPDWYDLLCKKDKITIVLDADAPGQDGAREIARRIGFDRCYNVLLPLHDANDVLVKLGPEELARTLEDEEQFEVPGVLSASEVCKAAAHEVDNQEPGILTPWPQVNGLLGTGWHAGDLITLSAKVKVGKTTLALNLLHHTALQGIPSLIYCLEMSSKRLVQKLVGKLRNKDYETLTKIDWQVGRYMLRDVPLEFIEPEWRATDPERVFNRVREAVKRYGIKIFCFDNLHFLCRSKEHLAQEVGNVTRDFKMLSEELGIVTILIAQPKKIYGQRVITTDDIKDSSAIPADSDQIILLHRNKRPVGIDDDSNVANASDREVLDPKTMLRVDAARFRGGGECYLWYEGETSTFYGWEDRPIQKL